MYSVKATIYTINNHSLILLLDIDKTVNTLDSVLGFYHVAKDVESQIKEG